jgi:L-fuconolactonase
MALSRLPQSVIQQILHKKLHVHFPHSRRGLNQMPDFPIIDSHVHLWDPEELRMSWLDGSPLLNKRYAIPEFKQHTAGVHIEAFVYLEVGLEPQYGLLEPHWVIERAKEDPRLQAIVAQAPLEFGDQVRSYLKALTQIDKRVKGVRRIVQGEKDPKFCLQPRFVRGTQILHEFGLSCDICINHTQLGPTVELVKQCPDTQFILDHIGKPNIKEHVIDPWREQIKQLAALPNVICKVSGAVTEADREKWTVDDLKPYILHVLECFGEDRVAFGGDWPVALLASKYVRWVKSLDELTAHLKPEAKKKLWAENARRFYRMQ